MSQHPSCERIASTFSLKHLPQKGSIELSHRLASMYPEDARDTIGETLLWISNHDLLKIDSDEQIQLSYFLDSLACYDDMSKEDEDVRLNKLSYLAIITKDQSSIIADILDEIRQKDLWWVNKEDLAHSAIYWRERSIT